MSGSSCYIVYAENEAQLNACVDSFGTTIKKFSAAGWYFIKYDECELLDTKPNTATTIDGSLYGGTFTWSAE